MNLPEVFTSSGRKELAIARDEIARLQRKAEVNKNGLTGKEKTALKSHQALLQRNQRFKVGAVIVGALGLGGVAVAMNASNDESPAEVPLSDTPTANPPSSVEHTSTVAEREMAIDALVARIETAFPRFRQRLEANLRRMGGEFPASYIRSAVFWAPFEVVEINKANPNRNYERFQQVARATGNTDIGGANFFLYDQFSHESNGPRQSTEHMSAAYAPAEKTMMIPVDFDPDSVVDLLTLYHELQHTVEDSNVRARINSEQEYLAYRAFVTGRRGERSRMTIENETGAYSYEIEALNILLNDQLRQQNGNMSVDEICNILHLTSEKDRNYMSLMVDMARTYYPHGATGGIYNDAFPALISANYRALGYDIYSRRPDGRIVPWNR